MVDFTGIYDVLGIFYKVLRQGKCAIHNILTQNKNGHHGTALGLQQTCAVYCKW